MILDYGNFDFEQVAALQQKGLDARELSGRLLREWAGGISANAKSGGRKARPPIGRLTMRSGWIVVLAPVLAACGSGGNSVPNWGFVLVDDTTSTASAGFYKGIGLDQGPTPITESDECVAYPVESDASATGTAVDAGAVTITGSVEARLTALGYRWQGTEPISAAGQRVGVVIDGSVDVPPVQTVLATPPAITLTEPVLSSDLVIDSTQPLDLRWTRSSCTVGVKLADADTSLQCAWAGEAGAATIPPQLLSLVADSASSVTFSVDCASWQHPTASDWAFTFSIHTFYDSVDVTVR